MVFIFPGKCIIIAAGKQPRGKIRPVTLNDRLSFFWFMNVGTGLPDCPSGKFDLDGQIFPHFTGNCFDFGASSPKIKNGPSRTPVPTYIAITAINDHFAHQGIFHHRVIARAFMPVVTEGNAYGAISRYNL